MSDAAYTLVDNTGCRAPFWRQLKGDIAYIDAVLHDSSDVVCITASTHGYLSLIHISEPTRLGMISYAVALYFLAR